MPLLKLIRVHGNSLRPEVGDGDVVLLLTWRALWRLRPGDLAVFRQPSYGMMIKKIERLDESARTVFVVGTHAASVDSYEFGPLPLASIVGKVIYVARRSR